MIWVDYIIIVSRRTLKLAYLQACQPPSAISVRIALRIRHEPRPKILNVAVKYKFKQRKMHIAWAKSDSYMCYYYDITYLKEKQTK